MIPDSRVRFMEEVFGIEDIRPRLYEYADGIHLVDAINNTIDAAIRSRKRKPLHAERALNMLLLSFGFEDEQPMSYDDIGRTYGVTRETVRKTVDMLLHSIRHPVRARMLHPYVEGLLKRRL